jgi:outer membrane protein insertion porin family
VQWLGFRQAVNQLEATVELDGTRARFDDLRALFGGGELTGAGELRLGAGGVEEFAVAVEGAGVKVAWPEGFEGLYEGRLTWQGRPDQSELGGRLVLLRGLYDEEFDVGGIVGGAARDYEVPDPESFEESVVLDLDLVSDGNFWVRNDQMRLESGFDLHAGGTLGRPRLSGRLGLQEGGTLAFRNIDYRIDSGSLDFVGQEELNPYLTLNADTSVGGYEVNLHVEGALDQLEYELTSSPALAQQDIIALLTTGRTFQDLRATGSGAEFTGDLAANYFAGALTSRFERQLRGLLGVDRFTIDPLLIEGEADPTTRITVGKEVTDDVTVIVSTSVGGTSRQLYQVDWQATRKLRVAVQNTQESSAGDLRFTNRYWWKLPPRETEPAVPAEVGRGVPMEGASRVTGVEIRGVSPEDAKLLVERLPLRGGEAFRRSDMFAGVETIRRHYVERGRIECSVDAEARPDPGDPQAQRVLYDVETGPVYQVRLENVGKKEARRLRSRLNELWSGWLFSRDLLGDSAELIAEAYRERGYYTVDVDWSLVTEDGERALRFVIDRGKTVRVRSVGIEGAEQISEARILGQVLTRPASLFSKGRLVPSVLEDDLVAIRSLYRDEGYLGVKLDPPRIRLTADGAEADVVLRITEGPQFTIAGLEYPDDLSFPRERMQSWSGLEVEQVFSPARLLAAEGDLRAGLDAEGYPDARVASAIEREDASVRVRFEIDTGTRKKVGEIAIEGTLQTKEKVILRELELAPGDPISRQKLLASQHKLYRLGIFRSVRLSYSPISGDDPALQRLEVRVEESKPLAMSIGLGYDTEQGVRTSFATTYSNVGGAGRVLSLQGWFSRKLQRVQIVGEEPRLFGQALPGLFTFQWEQDEREGFTLQSRSLALRVDRRLAPKWGGYVRYAFKRDTLSDITDDLAAIEDKVENIRLGNVGVSLIRDSRDNPVAATRGTYLSVGNQLFAGFLLSDANFLKTLVEGTYVRTFRNRTEFASAVRVGTELPFGSTVLVPISERFFAGGDSTLRGFAFDEVGPTLGDVPVDGDPVDPEVADTPIGGQALLILNEEFRFPIWAQLRGVVFYDVGNVWLEVSDVDLGGLRQNVGVGLHYLTPIGPLRVEYGRKLDREPGETKGELFFAIGTAF